VDPRSSHSVVALASRSVSRWFAVTRSTFRGNPNASSSELLLVESADGKYAAGVTFIESSYESGKARADAARWLASTDAMPAARAVLKGDPHAYEHAYLSELFTACAEPVVSVA